jgi:dihydrolipoamide dehydrogenase
VSIIEIKVPDLGDYADVDVIEVYVSAGDTVNAEDPIIAIETDKAAIDVPAPRAGLVESVNVAPGHKVSAGDVILRLRPEVDESVPSAPAVADAKPSLLETGVESSAAGEPQSRANAAAESSLADLGLGTVTAAAAIAAVQEDTRFAFGPKVVVLGSGPGGYTAAFRAADLGLDVTLVERWPRLGGVCLNVGCIPSKALLHAARVVEEAADMADFGISFGEPVIDADKLRGWKNKIVGQLTGGLEGLAKQRNVTVVHGTAKFASANTLLVEHDGVSNPIEFDQCIIAVGSESMQLPGLPDDPRIMDSTDALELDQLPERLLVIGGGIIGLEMATVYDALGVKVSVVELTETLISGCDRDVVRPLEKRIRSRYEAIMLGTAVTKLVARDNGIEAHFEGAQAPSGPEIYGRVLVAVGRRPNGGTLAAEAAGVIVTERGYIDVDKQMRTNVPHIYAVGDVVGQPMLAHKATHQGKVAAEVAAGKKSFFDARVIPSVAYTDPEVAWVGLTEEGAKADGIAYDKGSFPWAASGRSLSIGRSEGMSKLLFDKQTGHLIGAGIVGTNAGDLIAEACLAIELGCDAADIGLTIHPHPTLSETLAFAAEAAEGTITDLYLPKR